MRNCLLPVASTAEPGRLQNASQLELSRFDLVALDLKSLHRQRFLNLITRCETGAPSSQSSLRDDVCSNASAAAVTRREMRETTRLKAQLIMVLQPEQGYGAAAFAWATERLADAKRLLRGDDASSPAPPLTSKVSLFDGTLSASRAASWAPWTPRLPPWPATHPLGWDCMLGWMRLPGQQAQEMCLNPRDHLSRKVNETGRWRDCQQLVTEWKHNALGSGEGRGIFLELGANIGSCTLELLLSTTAKALAFEPSAVNLYHLTRTLRLAATTRDDARGLLSRRAVVFPVGAGQAATMGEMSNKAGNFGDSQIIAPGSGKGSEHGPAHLPVQVYRLDDLLPQLPLPEPVRLMKIDIQGFECKAIRGAAALLLSGSVHAIIAETSKLLKRQGCSAPQLRAYLRAAGFSIVVAGTAGIVTGGEAITLARLNP